MIGVFFIIGAACCALLVGIFEELRTGRRK